MPNKLTDNEIIKAWVVIKERKRTPTKYLINETLDLINRQKAEIERLEKGNTALMNERNTLSANLEFLQKVEKNCREERNSLWYRVQTAKAEAYKEFAERLKKKYPWLNDYLYSTKKIVEDIDNLLKEMVGGK